MDITPQLAGQKAEQAILQYTDALGVKDPDMLVRVLEMLISKASIAIAQVSTKNAAQSVLLRSHRNLDKVIPDRPKKHFN